MWADTFMMHQDEFPAYHKVYKQLCLEKVVFPARDPNMRMLMENVCANSPMFDHVEQLANRDVRQPLEKPKPQIAQPPPENDGFDFDQDFSGPQFEHIDLSGQNHEMIRQTCELLCEMCMQATELSDLQNEITREIFSSLAFIRKQLEGMIRKIGDAALLSESQAVKYMTLQSMVELIESNLTLFRERYTELKS